MGYVDKAKGLTRTFHTRLLVAWTATLVFAACSSAAGQMESPSRTAANQAMVPRTSSDLLVSLSPSLNTAFSSHDFDTEPMQQSIAALFAGGPMYKNGKDHVAEIKKSGFTNLIVWTIHVEANGDLGFNGEFILVKDGQYIGDQNYPAFRTDLAKLKQAPSSVERIEFALSAAGSGTYDHIKRLATCLEGHCGLGPDSVLYRNFRALRTAFHDVDAVNNDDERVYDLATAVPFHAMLADLGLKTSISPYTNQPFWGAFVTALNRARPGSADIAYLQVYDGGAGNDPCNWQLGIPVVAGMWSKYTTPSAARDRLRSWSARCQVSGGFLWLYDEIVGTQLVKEYADALKVDHLRSYTP